MTSKQKAAMKAGRKKYNAFIKRETGKGKSKKAAIAAWNASKKGKKKPSKKSGKRPAKKSGAKKGGKRHAKKGSKRSAKRGAKKCARKR
jgi:hypothetical protein